MGNKITIIIPVYNESKNIGELIDTIIQQYNNIDIFVIDDFSTDATIKVVNKKILEYKEQKIKLITKNNKDEKGLTFSIIQGIENIETEYFIVMDGDFQHPVKNINNFLVEFKKGSEVVIGERKEIVFKEKQYRILVSKIGNFLINSRLRNTGLHFKDPLSGFFGGKTKIFQKIICNNKNNFLGKGYKFLFDFLKLIKKNQFLIATFDFNFAQRKFGESKISSTIFIEFIKGILK